VTDAITVPSAGESAVDPLSGLVYVGTQPDNMANVTIVQAVPGLSW
jgi:hypothetical protein